MAFEYVVLYRYMLASMLRCLIRVLHVVDYIVSAGRGDLHTCIYMVDAGQWGGAYDVGRRGRFDCDSFVALMHEKNRSPVRGTPQTLAWTLASSQFSLADTGSGWRAVAGHHRVP